MTQYQPTLAALRRLTPVVRELYDSLMPEQKPHDLDGPLAEAEAALALSAPTEAMTRAPQDLEEIDRLKLVLADISNYCLYVLNK